MPPPPTPRPGVKRLPPVRRAKRASTYRPLKHLTITNPKLGMLSTLPTELRDIIFGLAFEGRTTVLVYKDPSHNMHYSIPRPQRDTLLPGSSAQTHLSTFRNLTAACPSLASDIRSSFFSTHTFELAMVNVYSRFKPQSRKHARRPGWPHGEVQMACPDPNQPRRIYNVITEKVQYLVKGDHPDLLAPALGFTEKCLPHIRKLIVRSEARYTWVPNVPRYVLGSKGGSYSHQAWPTKYEDVKKSWFSAGFEYQTAKKKWVAAWPSTKDQELLEAEAELEEVQRHWDEQRKHDVYGTLDRILAESTGEADVGISEESLEALAGCLERERSAMYDL